MVNTIKININIPPPPINKSLYSLFTLGYLINRNTPPIKDKI
jgi:hypothetical protein